MKNKTTPNRLIRKHTFERRLSELQQKHEWFFQGKSLDMRPGWMHVLDATLTKMKRMLTAEDTASSRLEFLYCATKSRLQIFVDADRLSQARFKVIDHLLDQAMHKSDEICPKCGCSIDRNHFSRPNSGCEAHRDFEGDFAEDYRRHLKLKKRAEEVEAKIQRDQAESEMEAIPDSEPSVEVVTEDVEGRSPRLRLYDIDEVLKLKQSIKSRSADSDSRSRLKSICDDLIERGEYRPCCHLPELEVLGGLAQRFPNFTETIGVIRSAVALANLGDGTLEIPPLLLVGPPGIGKTQVANELAGLFETDFLEIRMETEQSGAGISGSSEFWSNTQAGQLFNVLTTGRTANPIVLLDELDKAGGDNRFNPVGGLYSLLERETARRFEDQSIRGLKIDASAVIWVITANDETLIPEPILSRVVVQHIRPPTKEESIMIAHSIYASIRQNRPWGEYFSPELSRDVAEKLSKLEPRQMKVCLHDAFGKAALASRGFISPDDVPTMRPATHIGFLPNAN
jgi:ATP-dependent Lon protease